MSGGSSKQSPPTTTVQETTIPAELRPLVSQQATTGADALAALQAMLGGAGADNIVAGFDPLQIQAQQQAIDFAGGAGGFLPTAQDALMRTARGDFLYGGEGFDQAVDAATRQVQPHILSTFGGAGRGTGGLAQTAIAQAISDAFAGQYGAERARQLTAATALPEFGLLSSDILSQIGGQRQGMDQKRLMAPITAQEMLLQAAGGGVPLGAMLGSTSTGTQPIYNNRGAGVLGGAASGAATGTMIMPGWGTAIGAVAGGLLGGMG